MRLAIVLIGLFIVIAGLVITAATSTSKLVQRLAVVKECIGDVKINRKDATAINALSADKLVEAGDSIITGKDGTVRLRWVDGYELEIRPNSKLTVERTRFRTKFNRVDATFRLDIGNVLSTISRKLTGRSRFEMRTPSVTAAVRGTTFESTVDESGNTEIRVINGEVALTSASDQELTLKPGESRVVKSNGTIVDGAEETPETN